MAGRRESLAAGVEAWPGTASGALLHQPRFAYDAAAMLSLPNVLTLSRIFAVPLLVFLLWRPSPIDYLITFVLYCLVGITDYFDGYLARAQGKISRLGQFLDPIADKIMVAAVIVMLMASRRADGDPPILQDLSIIPALVILLREIIVSGLREFLAPLNVSMPVSALAKWKTTLQLVALGALILGGAFPLEGWIHQTGIAALWAAAVLTLVTGYDYLRVGLKHMD